MDSPIVILRYAVLAILFAPLLAALSIALLPGSWPRRVAGAFALIHLLFTAAVAFLAATELTQRSDYITKNAGTEAKEFSTFQPIFVPGDPGFKGDANSQTYATTWSVLSVGKAQPGVPPADVQFFIGIDGLNVWLVLLTSLMTYIAVLVSWRSITERSNGYYAWLFVLQTGLIGAFLSFDVILFYAFFELTLIPAFFLIGSWGVGGSKRDAARKFFLYTLLGSLLTLTGVIGIVVTNPTPMLSPTTPTYGHFPANGEMVAPQPGPITFSIPSLMKNVNAWSNVKPTEAYRSELKLQKATATAAAAKAKAEATPNDPTLRRLADDSEAARSRAEGESTAAANDRDHYRGLQVWFFVALVAGFAVKVPLVPFHTWLPAAYAEAPMGVTLILSALMAKLGTYGLLRIVLPLAPEPSVEYGLPVLGGLGAFGIIYAAFCAYAQRDLKLLTAYSSVSHLGFLVVGLFAFNTEGITGASLHMVNHGLSTGAMFGLLGFLAVRYQTLDMNQFGGLMGRYPGFAFLLVVISLASIGLPGLNNFVSEMLMLSSVFEPSSTSSVGYWLAAAAVAGLFLSAWYTMTMLRRVLFGPLQEPTTATVPTGLTQRETIAFALPALLCVVLGLYPQPVIDTMKADVALVVKAGDNARTRSSDARP